MKSLILFTLVCLLSSSSLWAEKARTVFLSPNGAYGVRIGKDDSGDKTFTLVRVKTGEVLCSLDAVESSRSTGFRLIWAPDSQRAASISPDKRGGQTFLFVRAGATFTQIEFPDLPVLDTDSRPGGKTTNNSILPVRWTKANVLQVDHEIVDDDGVSTKQRIVLTFSDKNEIKLDAGPIVKK